MGIKSEFWKPHLAGWRSSGLSQAAYCRQHGLELKRFCYWRRTLGSKATSSSALLPIVVSSPVVMDRIELRLPNGLQLVLPLGLDTARLLPMIRALRAC